MRRVLGNENEPTEKIAGTAIYSHDRGGEDPHLTSDLEIYRDRENP